MRVCIIDDDPSLLDHLRLLLDGEPGISVAGSYASAEAALEEAHWPRLDLLLLDLRLPGMSGLDLIRRVRARWPHVQVLVYTISDNVDTVLAALKCGAFGYLLKGGPPRELIESLYCLQQGGAPMSPRIARKVVRALQVPGRGAEPALLTQREMEILSSISLGRSYKEIGQALHLSPHTVHTHIKHIYEKLHATIRAEALQRARELDTL